LGRGEKGRDFDISFFGDFPSSSHRPAATRVVCRCVVDGMGANADATARVDASENAANFMVAFVRCREQNEFESCNYDMTKKHKRFSADGALTGLSAMVALSLSCLSLPDSFLIG
jgi:hypothetical protein